MKAFFTKIWEAVKQWPGKAWAWIRPRVFVTGAGWSVSFGAIAALIGVAIGKFWVILILYVAALVAAKFLVEKLTDD